MKVNELINKLNLTLFNGNEEMNNEIKDGYTSDLLSDVMGNAEEGMVWITMQTHANVVAVASLKDIAAVLIVNGLKPDEEMLAKSRDEGIPILGTTLSAFEATGKIYHLLKNG